MHALYHLYQHMLTYIVFFPCQRITIRNIQANGHLADMETTQPTSHRPAEDVSGSDMALSESAGRVLPDDRELGAQSEDLRNGGAAHAIIASPDHILHAG